MRKIIIFLFVIVIVCFGVEARLLSVDEVKQQIIEFVDRQMPERMPSIIKEDYLQLAHVVTNIEDENLIYIFNKGKEEGFIIVSGDDRVVPILGYSDTGIFDATDLPSNFIFWLECCERQIQYSIDNDISLLEVSTDDEYTPIEPLLTTKWGQRAPYNNHCPIDPETGERCVTGCVSTAVAQIMNYYQWPDKGVGEKELGLQGNKGDEKIYVNFGETEYRWDKMLDEYDENSPEESCDAVAELMLHTGVALSTMYGSESTVGGSLSSLTQFLKYSESDFEGYVSYNLFENIYTELKNNRPVFCGAETFEPTHIGHAFVCDGYSGDGYFHINWGWNGNSDGYYLLSALNPSEREEYKFELGTISVSINPDNIIKNPGERILNGFYSGEFSKTEENIFFGVEAYNSSVEEVKGKFGIRLTSMEGEALDKGEVLYIESIEKFTLVPHVRIDGFSFRTIDFPKGMFLAKPFFIDESTGEWETIKNWEVKNSTGELKLISDDLYLSFSTSDINKTIPTVKIISASLRDDNRKLLDLSFEISQNGYGDYIDEQVAVSLYKINKKGRKVRQETILLSDNIFLIGSDVLMISTTIELSNQIDDEEEDYCIAVTSAENRLYSDYYTIYESEIESVVASSKEMQLQQTSDGKGILVQSKDLVRSVSVYSISGNELIQRRNINKESIFVDITNLQGGIYIVNAESDTAKKTMKIIVR